MDGTGSLSFSKARSPREWPPRFSAIVLNSLAGGVLVYPVDFLHKRMNGSQAFLDGLAGLKHGLDTNRFNERVSGHRHPLQQARFREREGFGGGDDDVIETADLDDRQGVFELPRQGLVRF